MRTGILLGLVIILGILIIVPCYAVGDADTYKITVKTIRLRDSSSGSWVIIASPNQEVDIASVSAGAVAGSMASSAKVPVGSYDNFLLEVSEVIKFSGTDGTTHTKSGGSVTLTGNDADDDSTATWDSFPPDVETSETVATDTTTLSEKGEITATLDLENGGGGDTSLYLYGSSNLSTPITVNADSVISMSFDFDTQNTATLSGDIMIFAPPQDGSAFSITVDEVTTTITESEMQMDWVDPT